MDTPKAPPTYYEVARARWKQADWYKCSTCGFLTRVGGGSGGMEISAVEREVGASMLGSYVATGFYCFVNAPGQNISYEIGQLLRAGNTQIEAGSAVLQRDRQCKQWHPWTPGASPLWHIEDRRMNYLEEVRAHREQELAALTLTAAADSKSVAESLHQVTIETGKFTTKWTYIAVGVAGVALLLVAAGYLFPALGPTLGHWLLPSVQGTPKP